MKTKDISQAIVGFMVMVSFLIVLWAVFKIEMPEANRDLALILLGVLASKFGDVVGYFFNSSKGSSEKTDIISKLPSLSVLLLPLFLLALMSCGTTKHIVKEVPVQYKEKIVERLVAVPVAADSSSLEALFVCDSLNNVILKELNEAKGKAESGVKFTDGKLTYKLIVQHDTVYVTAKDSIIYKEIPLRVEIPTITNQLTKWQGFQIVGFRILSVALVLMLAVRYFGARLKTTFKSILKP